MLKQSFTLLQQSFLLCCSKVLDKLCCNKVLDELCRDKVLLCLTLCWAFRMLMSLLKNGDVVTLKCLCRDSCAGKARKVQKLVFCIVFNPIFTIGLQILVFLGF